MEATPTGRRILLEVPDNIDTDRHVIIACPECKGMDFRVLVDKAPPNVVVALLCECGAMYHAPQCPYRGPEAKGSA